MTASDDERNPRRDPDGRAPTGVPAPHIPDLAAAKRLQAILSSPSYRKADEDIDFLASANARGPRLELEYLKAELLLRRHGVNDTIVVFGSTRIVEPDLAERRRAEAGAGKRRSQ